METVAMVHKIALQQPGGGERCNFFFPCDIWMEEQSTLSGPLTERKGERERESVIFDLFVQFGENQHDFHPQCTFYIRLKS